MRIGRISAFVLAIVMISGVSWGFPALQVYVEGGTYDSGTETWIVTDSDGPIRLWVIGNTGGSGTHGDIVNVRLAIAYVSGDDPVNINIASSTTEGYNGIADPSTPSTPTYIQTVSDGSLPLLSDGTDLPSHGVYTQEGVEWQEYMLGDFTLQDSPVGDFVGTFPSVLEQDSAQINVYEINVVGAEWFHFDVYDSTQSPTRAVFAPFGHDAGSDGLPPVPEPGTIVLVGLGILAAAALRSRESRKRAAQYAGGKDPAAERGQRSVA